MAKLRAETWLGVMVGRIRSRRGVISPIESLRFRVLEMRPSWGLRQSSVQHALRLLEITGCIDVHPVATPHVKDACPASFRQTTDGAAERAVAVSHALLRRREDLQRAEKDAGVVGVVAFEPLSDVGDAAVCSQYPGRIVLIDRGIAGHVEVGNQDDLSVLERLAGKARKDVFLEHVIRHQQDEAAVERFARGEKRCSVPFLPARVPNRGDASGCDASSAPTGTPPDRARCSR